MAKRNDLLDYNQIKWAITPNVLFKLALVAAVIITATAQNGIQTVFLFILTATIIIPSTKPIFLQQWVPQSSDF
jgi:hypothetical protein